MPSIEFTMVSRRVIEISFLTDISGNSIKPDSDPFSALADPAPLANPVPSKAALTLFTSFPFPCRDGNCDLLPYLSATTDRARAGKHATDHTPQRQVEFPYTSKAVSSQDYQTRQPTTEEGNLSGPIRTGHNQHTHTGHTRQPEPQLKGFSCSSAIPSHNSRDVIPSHNSRNTTCLTPIPSHNSRDTFRATTQGTPATPPLKHHQKPRRSRLENQQHQY
ncbi:hypothetical protein DEO72_LG8g1766 [Vigna unguiculata]|uniref:Uncharacterized protein n=1 Tax=Vigna unguiculata TaxID=3917 RepID=A0A4D6MSY2_VIGUN|nr:hypothetical protein DEO72_LG8g1766 [Vigna unguiculata]